MSVFQARTGASGSVGLGLADLSDGSEAVQHVALGADGNPIVPAADASIQALGAAVAGAVAAAQAFMTNRLDAYRYKKAINANPATAAAGGVDAMLAYCQAAQTSPGSNAMQAATTNILAPSGGDFETLVLVPWLAGALGATPPGLGLSAASSPTLAALVATLRASAIALGS